MAAPKYQNKRPKNMQFWVTKANGFFEIRTHGGGRVVSKVSWSADVREIMHKVKDLGCKNMAEVYSDIMFLKRSFK